MAETEQQEQPARPAKRKIIDLTPLTNDRIHLHGCDCALIRALKTLQGLTRRLPGQPTIEFWQVNNTNPAKVKASTVGASIPRSPRRLSRVWSSTSGNNRGRGDDRH